MPISFKNIEWEWLVNALTVLFCYDRHSHCKKEKKISLHFFLYRCMCVCVISKETEKHDSTLCVTFATFSHRMKHSGTKGKIQHTFSLDLSLYSLFFSSFFFPSLSVCLFFYFRCLSWRRWCLRRKKKEEKFDCIRVMWMQ